LAIAAGSPGRGGTTATGRLDPGGSGGAGSVGAWVGSAGGGAWAVKSAPRLGRLGLDGSRVWSAGRGRRAGAQALKSEFYDHQTEYQHLLICLKVLIHMFFSSRLYFDSDGWILVLFRLEHGDLLIGWLLPFDTEIVHSAIRVVLLKDPQPSYQCVVRPAVPRSESSSLRWSLWLVSLHPNDHSFCASACASGDACALHSFCWTSSSPYWPPMPRLRMIYLLYFYVGRKLIYIETAYSREHDIGQDDGIEIFFT